MCFGCFVVWLRKDKLFFSPRKGFSAFLSLFFAFPLFRKTNHAEGFIFGGLHQGALPRSLIVDAAQVQHSVHYHAMEFFFVTGVLPYGIAAHGVEAYEDVAIDDVAFGIVEGDNVGIVVVGKVSAVYLENLLVIAELVAQLAYDITMGSSHGTQPPRCVAAAQRGEGYVGGVIGDHEIAIRN